MSPSLPARVADGLAALLFLASAAVQLNDPDPVGWTLMYGSAALAATLAAAGRCPRWLPWAVGAVALAWLAAWIPQLQRVDPHDVFGPAGMYPPGVEEAREAGGLVLILAWMGGLGWRLRR